MADPNYRSHEGYSSLSASSLPGSVPAAADVDSMLLPFQEANLQTFPPSNAHSKLLGSYPSHAGEESTGSRPQNGDESQGGLPRFLRVSTYQPYFDVNTEDVSQRILHSLLLNWGEFMTVTNHNPDLSSWQFDIGKVNWAAGLFYAYTFLLPLLLYFFLKYINVALGLVQLWCLYGYSLFVFIPVSFIALVPVSVLKWVVVAGAGLISTTFVITSLKMHLGSSEWSFVVIIGLIILQASFALAFKILFFA